MKKTNKGFTLIELLVVIAIIGILSAVVLASLNTARSKGKDASAQSSMESIRSQAEICYNGGTACGQNTYGTASTASNPTTANAAGATANVTTNVCGDTQVLSLMKAAAAQAGQTVTCSVGPSGANYESHVVLNSGGTFCVDSSGFSGSTSPSSVAIGSATAGANAKCQ